ncbi:MULTISPECIES: hypothetical protein [Paenibacillus]|uniref:Uncharacterized protein n=1 Tax=Paenibacillus barengoltzii J12 TaxID=935846 RepID=A0ABY1M3B4_9BACL|nr:hypothetical protein [Paenibacillus barengoltzii]SMF66531.1 hypothetical protein SAMN02744124_04275 [Paenibacillus barengoltzii J12]
MKKALKLFLMFSVILLCLVQPVSAATSTVKLKVTLVRVELVENNHVGNEWYTTASVNGKEIEEGSSVTLKLKSSESLKLKAYAEEQDKIPESGSANATVKVSSVTKDITKSLKVKVTENRGRYSGNTAEWKFTFKVQKSK